MMYIRVSGCEALFSKLLCSRRLPFRQQDVLGPSKAHPPSLVHGQLFLNEFLRRGLVPSFWTPIKILSLLIDVSVS